MDLYFYLRAHLLAPVGDHSHKARSDLIFTPERAPLDEEHGIFLASFLNVIAFTLGFWRRYR